MLFFKKPIKGIIAKLSNLKLAIFLLLLIAATSVSGTVIEQNQPLTFYQTNYPIHINNIIDFNWKVILFLGLNQVYKNAWFLALLTLFGSCLLACTFTTQLPTLKRLRRWTLTKKNINNSKDLFLSIKNPFNNNKISNFHHKKSYYTLYQRDGYYLSKGIIGRVAPILVHISIILILVGSAISAVDSFFIQEMIPKRETYHLQNIIDAGNVSKISQGLSIRANNFWITYNDAAITNQFYSDISLIDNNGNEVKRDQIFVNKPLIFNGFTIYQTDWNIVGMQLKVEVDKNLFNIQVPAVKIQDDEKVPHWCTNLPSELLKENITICTDTLISKLSIYDNNGKRINQVSLNEIIQTPKNEKLSIEDLITATGLQIKKDSGVQLIYSGFAFLILSTYLSYISYMQIWIKKEENQYKIIGSSNRAIYAFKKEIILNFKNRETNT